MSGMQDNRDLADQDHLLLTRGASHRIDGFVTSCAFSRDGSAVAYATGEGALVLSSIADPDWNEVALHDGAVLSLAADVVGDGFLTGGDDNALRRIAGDGSQTLLAKGRRWVDHVVSHAKTGLIAASSAKRVELRDASGAVIKSMDHDSTVSGIVFDAKGKRIAVSHYGGASLWFTGAKSETARKLAWKGSHIGVALHPDGEALVTAMQENELHGWRLSDGHNMRMSGYPAKTQSFAFSRNGKWLATSGAEAVVLWPFFGGGPMGKAPTELAGVPDSLCTRVAFHPQHEIVAAGFADGTVLMSDVGTKRVLPVCGPGRGPVSALAFNPDGTRLAFGTEAGWLASDDLSAR
jgi:WD40 repeat protein